MFQKVCYVNINCNFLFSFGFVETDLGYLAYRLTAKANSKFGVRSLLLATRLIDSSRPSLIMTDADTDST